MFELVRVFLGYCINCRRACTVGEFKVAGWHHVFNLCEHCLQKKIEELNRASMDLINKQFEGTDMVMHAEK